MSETKPTNMEKAPSSDHINEPPEPQTPQEAHLSTQQVDTQLGEKVSLGNQAGAAELKPTKDETSSPRGSGMADTQPVNELQTADPTELAVPEPRDELPPPVDAGLVSSRPVEEFGSINKDAIIVFEQGLGLPDLPLPPTKSAAVDEPRKTVLQSEKTINEKLIGTDRVQEFQSMMMLHDKSLDSVSTSGPEVNKSIHSNEALLEVGSKLSPICSASKNGSESEMGISPKGDPVQDTLVPGLNDCQEQEIGHERLSRPDDSATEIPVKEENVDLNAEFELDSSPIESSSPCLSTDSSSSEDSDQDEYVMLDPAEQARRLMQEEGGSDDETGGKPGDGAGSGPLRTLNEKPDEVVPKPDLEITREMKISELGDVENLVENLVLIKGKTSGEYQVLEFGSVLCLEDRSVIGVIAETLGRVQQPFYSVRFTNAAAISEVGISQGTKIFYVDQFSTSVFTQTLKAFKGSDASNLHDEEAGDAEIEFSDDEAEAEYRRRLKVKKQARRDGRQDHDGFSHGVQQSRGKHQKRTGNRPHGHNNTALIKSEVKVEDDELYTPLARPPNLHEIMGQREAPIETRTTYHHANRGVRGDRARGDRGRGRGERGRGNPGSRGGFENRSRHENDPRNRNGRNGPGHRNGHDRKSDGNSTNDLSQRFENNTFHSPPPPPPPADVGFGPYSAAQNSPVVATTTSTFQPYPPAFAHQNYPNQHHDLYGQIYPQPQYHPPQSYPPPNYQQQQQQPRPQHPYPNHHHHQPSSSLYTPYQPQFQTPPSNIPPGAHVNPAFFPPQTTQNPPSYPSQQRIFRQGVPNIVGGEGEGREGNSRQQAAGHSPGSDAAFRAAQERLDFLRTLTNQGSGPPS
ncbi:hypothetical protein MMC22_000676 [Lobaria immixta]|nr:hypothetical protein [Lobaria immixta]